MSQQGIQPDVISRSAVMRSCARATAWRMALFLSSARQANMNAIALNEVQLACERACEWQLSLQQFEDSGERCVSADLRTFNAVIGVLESASRWQTVFRVLRCMVLETLPPDTVTYNAVGTACEKSTMWESTLWCLRAGSIQPDMITWTSAIGACRASCASCRWKRMLTLIRDAATGHLQPSLLICEKVVSTLWQSGKLAQMQFHLPRACSTKRAFEILRGEAVSHVRVCVSAEEKHV
ncbi:unnamed protein product [Symbiodinium sp. CCMP2456]|nr:unnamed protein product [Symbiodinium sp. CCMP2456]